MIRIELLLIFYFVSTKADSQVLKFKAVEFIALRYENKAVDPPMRKACDSFLVNLDMDKSILDIHSPKEQVFNLTPLKDAYGENDTVAILRFDGKNDKGDCRIKIIFYKLPNRLHPESFVLEYPDKTYMYYLEEYH